MRVLPWLDMSCDTQTACPRAWSQISISSATSACTPANLCCNPPLPVSCGMHPPSAREWLVNGHVTFLCRQSLKPKRVVFTCCPSSTVCSGRITTWTNKQTNGLFNSWLPVYWTVDPLCGSFFAPVLPQWQHDLRLRETFKHGDGEKLNASCERCSVP